MKKKLAVLIITMSLFLQGTLVYAYPNVFNDVELDKDWTIEFTKHVDESTLISENIGIMDFNNNRIATEVKVDEANPSIVRVTPSNPYIPKKGYVLYVKKDVTAQNGSGMDADVSVMFTAKDAPFYISKIDPIDKTQYMQGAYKYETVTPDKIADNTVYEHMNAIGAKFTSGIAGVNTAPENSIYREYYLGGEYELFSGKLVISGDNRFMSGAGYVNIYADENLVYSMQDIKAGFMPTDMSANVSGANKLKIEFGVDSQEVEQGTFFEAYIGTAKLTK